MRTRSMPLALAVGLLTAACSGGAAPSSTTTIPAATAVTTTTVLQEETIAGVPASVAGAVEGAMEGTTLERLPAEEIVLDIVDGCTAAAEMTDPTAFLDELTGIVAARMDQAGEPLSGEVSARYSQALGAAYSEVCPEVFGPALSAAGSALGSPPDSEHAAASALEALEIGLEGSPFEGVLDGAWPADEVVPVLEAVCALVDDGGSNVDVVDLVTGEILERFDPEQGDLGMLVIAGVTVAVVFLCPERSESVLGP